MKNNSTKNIRIQTAQSANREHSAPIYMTSSFTFENAGQGRALFAEEESGNIYSRFSNPNVSEFIEKMATLEKMDDGFAYASGMAAVFGALAAFLKAGDHVISSRSLFGSTHQILSQILARWNITHTYIDATDSSGWAKALRPETKLLFVETPSNPGLDVIDLQNIARLKERQPLIMIVDNTFATPLLQRPADFGADIIVHSATKYIDGQGRAIGGVAVGRQELIKDLRFFARQTGPSLSPFNAWLLSKSLETLDVRVQRHCENAQALATTLDGHTELENVRYPFLESHPQYALARRQMSAGGGIITMTVRGGLERAMRFIDAVQLASKSANLGDTRTIVTHPASTTHSKLSAEERDRVGIADGLVRISVGLEAITDIRDDVLQALEKSK